jgi:hypothetical protein
MPLDFKALTPKMRAVLADSYYKDPKQFSDQYNEDGTAKDSFDVGASWFDWISRSQANRLRDMGIQGKKLSESEILGQDEEDILNLTQEDIEEKIRLALAETDEKDYTVGGGENV